MLEQIDHLTADTLASAVGAHSDLVEIDHVLVSIHPGDAICNQEANRCGIRLCCHDEVVLVTLKKPTHVLWAGVIPIAFGHGLKFVDGLDGGGFFSCLESANVHIFMDRTIY